MERFNPLNDYLFLKIMGEKGGETQCLAFLNAVLADARKNPIALVEILENRILSPEILGDKTSILDLHVLDETGAKYEIEVQLKACTTWKNVPSTTGRKSIPAPSPPAPITRSCPG